jgi:hypothetical protein
MVEAFEGNKAETQTMIPTIIAFKYAHRLSDDTVVTDAGMVSEASRKAIDAAGLSFIVAMKFTYVPNEVLEWRKAHPGAEIPDGHVFVQPWPPGPNETHRDQVIYCQYRADLAPRMLRGIDEQIGKAEKAVAGKTPVKRYQQS